MKVTLKYPGSMAMSDYIRQIMKDGRFRTSGDVVMRAQDDGMNVSASFVGYCLNQLESDGFLRTESVKGEKIWKAKKRALEEMG